MKRKFTLLIAALALLTMIVQPGRAWGQTPTTWSHEFASPEAISNNSITVEGATWTVSTTTGAGSPTISAGNSYSKYGLKFGQNKSNYFGSVTFSTDYFDDYNVQSVAVEILNNGTKAGTLSAQQNQTNIGSTTQTFGSTWTTLTVNTTPGTGGSLSFTYSVEQAFYIHSITVTYTTGGGSTVAAPNITPANSAVALTDNIEMTCSTEGASIYYNINSNDDPTSSSTHYTAPFNLTADNFVNNTCIVKAIAIKNSVNSSVTTRTYTRAQVATPTISPVAGTYYDTQEVTLSCTTEGATIYYTTNGDNPTTTSSTYSAPFNIDASCTVKAIAAKNGYLVSEIAAAAYVIEAGYETICSQNWEGEMNGWTFVNVLGDQQWSISYSSGTTHYAKMNGYDGGAKANEDWIISPAFNLNEWNNATLSFVTAKNYNGNNLQVFFSNDYDGSDPTSATWDELTCTISSGSWTWTESGNISLSSYSGTNCYIGFKYTSTTSAAATWEVDDILLVGQESTTPMITADLSAMSFTYEAGASGSAASQALAIVGSHLTATIAANITQGADKFSISDDEETWATSLSLPLAGDVIAVRLNPGITTPGTYNGTITLTSTGADPVTVNLTGTVTDHLYSVLLSQPVAGGTIGADKETAQEGETVTLSYTAVAGFVFGSWAVEDENENPITVDGNNQFTMPASDVIVTATFSALPTYTITTVADPVAGGTVVTDGSAWEGKEVTVLVEANEGYALETLTATYVDGGSISHDITITNNTFVMPAYPVTVTATFVVNLNVTYDFSTAENFYTEQGGSTHPGTGSANNVDEFYYGNGDYFTTSRPTNGSSYFSNGYFMLGKSGALLNLPTFTNYNVTSIVLHSSTGHSTKVNVAIYSGDNLVASEQNWGTQNHDYTYTIPAAYQSSALSVKVTNGNNTQFTSITLVRESPSTDPVITVDPSTVNLPTANATIGTLDVTATNFSLDDVTESVFAIYDSNWENILTPGDDGYPTWLALDYNYANEHGTINYSVTANESTESREAHFKLLLRYNSDYIHSDQLTITQAGYVAPFAPVLYTRATSITSGQHYIIVGFDNDDHDNTYAMGEQKSNNRGAVLISEDGTYATVINENVYDFVITYVGKDTDDHDLYSIYNAGYLCTATGGNYLRTEDELSDNSKWAITLDATTSEASIVATESTYRNVMQFNYSSNNQLFSCYSSASQKPVYLYEKSAEAPVSNTLTVTCTDFDDNNGYYLIASPFDGVNPATIEGMTDGFDLYYFNQSASDGKEWRNYKATAFNLERGKGYLYAKSGTGHATFNFYGKAYTGDGTIDLTYDDMATLDGWNLIGNPYATAATLDKPYYRLNSDGSALNAQTESSGINIMEGVFVKATATGQTATFTAQTKGGSQAIAKAEISVIGNRGSVVDNAIVRFDNGETLEKFCFRESNTKVYIPQNNIDYAIVSSEAKGVMPVNFKASETGNYTISFSSENIKFSYLHLIDSFTGEDIDLLIDDSYTFLASVRDRENRFHLVFNSNNANIDTTSDIFAYQNGNDIIVNGNGELQVFDVTGRMVMNTKINGIQTVNVPATGMYIFRMVGESVQTQKIVVR